MTLKRKIAINISIAFSILYGLSAVIIYVSFSAFRKEEFRNRLEEKALTTTRFLFEIRQIDRQLLQLIDQNTINKLYNEKTLVFDQDYNLIYSSLDDATISWNKSDLIRLKSKKKTFRSADEKEIFGVFYDFEKEDYYVLVAAEDKYGHQQLHFLLKLLLLSFFIGTGLVWFSTHTFIRKQLKPLDDFQQDITNITALRLNTKRQVSQERDEIGLLNLAFNQMLERIDTAFNAQKEFTANASHELRTPVSRLTLQLDALLRQSGHTPQTERYLHEMKAQLGQIAELIQSLLLLARTNEHTQPDFGLERIDEILFEALAKTKEEHPELHLNFEIAGTDPQLEINGSRSLLQIVFINLFRNAFLYSDNHKVNVRIDQTQQTLSISLSNSGNPIHEQEQQRIFEPFVRGDNAAIRQGSGLGLRIAKRILDYHGASISYTPQNGLHCFVIAFPRSN